MKEYLIDLLGTLILAFVMICILYAGVHVVKYFWTHDNNAFFVIGVIGFMFYCYSKIIETQN
jgi:hypothetical protein